MKTKHSVYIMLIGVGTGNHDMPPFFSPNGLKLHTEAYIKCLGEVVLHWLKRLATGRCYVNKTLHSHKRNPVLASRNFCDQITPKIRLPNSSDAFHFIIIIIIIMRFQSHPEAMVEVCVNMYTYKGHSINKVNFAKWVGNKKHYLSLHPIRKSIVMSFSCPWKLSAWPLCLEFFL